MKHIDASSQKHLNAQRKITKVSAVEHSQITGSSSIDIQTREKSIIRIVKVGIGPQTLGREIHLEGSPAPTSTKVNGLKTT